MSTSIQYLDKAMLKLRDLGLVPEKTEEAPIVVLLNRVSDLDQDKVVAIARTLSQTSLFNQVVREQVSGGKRRSVPMAQRRRGFRRRGGPRRQGLAKSRKHWPKAHGPGWPDRPRSRLPAWHESRKRSARYAVPHPLRRSSP